MFGCYCLYCDGQAVGWIHDSVLSLREVGLDYDQALELVLRVFMEFEAPDYSAEGVEAFVNDVINNEGFKQGCMEGAIKMYGAGRKKPF